MSQRGSKRTRAHAAGAEESKHDEHAAKRIESLSLPVLRKCLDFHRAEVSGRKSVLAVRLVELGVPFDDAAAFGHPHPDEATYNQFSVPELKRFLSAQGEPAVHGTRSDLVRVVAFREHSPDDVSDSLGEPAYDLTDETKCDSCGRVQQEDEVFCPKCPKPRACESCAVFQKPGARRCHKCGEDAPKKPQLAPHGNIHALAHQNPTGQASVLLAAASSDSDKRFLSRFGNATLAAVAAGERDRAELWRFLTGSESDMHNIRSGMAYSVTNGIQHVKILNKKPIISGIHFLVALTRLLRLRDSVCPHLAEDSAKLQQRVHKALTSSPPKTWEDMCAYVEGVRQAAAQEGSTQWGEFNSEMWAQHVHQLTVTRPPAKRSRPDSAPKPASAAHPRLPQDAFNSMKTNSLCLKFQRGVCQEVGDTHDWTNRTGEASLVKHKCAKCLSPAHGFFACP
jgi:uncharacterized OB-fold protein